MTIYDIKRGLLHEVAQHPEIYENVLPGAMNTIGNFVGDPLRHYNDGTIDVIIIPTLSKCFNLNVVTLHANDEKCWTNHTLYGDKLNTFYFGKSLSDHFNPILPVKKESIFVDLTIADDSDTEEIVVKENDVREYDTGTHHCGDGRIPFYKVGNAFTLFLLTKL